jgi:hypothetical protein
MASDICMFEVHYNGSFNRQNRYTYVGGLVDNHYVTDVHKMSFLNIEELCKDYGYKPSDLIHYKLPNKSLDEGLRLLSSDHDVNEMISQHVGHGLAELYLVSFHSSNAEIEDDNAEEDEEYERTVVYRKDDFWDEVLSVDTTDDDNDSVGEEQVESERVGVSNVVEDEEDRDGEDRDEEVVGEDANDGDRQETMGENYGGEDDGDSEKLCPSDILRTPDPSDSDCEDISSRPDVSKRTPFTEDDMKNPMLQIGHIFANATAFRRAVKHANILKGKDLEFPKNETGKVTARCKDKKCKYRVYGRKLKDESTFLLASLYPRHTCTRTYKNHMVTSAWIAEWCMKSFRN